MSFLSAMANLQAVESPLKVKVGKNPEGVDQAAIDRAQKWIDKINAMFPNHPFMRHWKVMTWGEGDDQELGMFQLETDPVYDGVVHIAWFQAFPMRQGVGTKAMRRLQDMAKADGITLSLEPWSKGKVPKSALTKFYKGVGFKKDKGTDLMIWKPEEDVKATYEGPTQAVHPPVSMGHYPEPENLPVKRKGRRASTSSTTLWDDDMNDNEPLKDKELVMLVKEPGSIADDGAHNTRRDG